MKVPYSKTLKSKKVCSVLLHCSWQEGVGVMRFERNIASYTVINQVVLQCILYIKWDITVLFLNAFKNQTSLYNQIK